MYSIGNGIIPGGIQWNSTAAAEPSCNTAGLRFTATENELDGATERLWLQFEMLGEVGELSESNLHPYHCAVGARIWDLAQL